LIFRQFNPDALKEHYALIRKHHKAFIKYVGPRGIHERLFQIDERQRAREQRQLKYYRQKVEMYGSIIGRCQYDRSEYREESDDILRRVENRYQQLKISLDRMLTAADGVTPEWRKAQSLVQDVRDALDAIYAWYEAGLMREDHVRTPKEEKGARKARLGDDYESSDNNPLDEDEDNIPGHKNDGNASENKEEGTSQVVGKDVSGKEKESSNGEDTDEGEGVENNNEDSESEDNRVTSILL
jgi:hypothetical protein